MAWWACKVKLKGSQEITKAGKTMTAKLMGTWIWSLFAGSVVRRAQERNNDPCAHFCLGESCPSSSHYDARKLNSSPYIPSAFRDVTPELEFRASESKFLF